MAVLTEAERVLLLELLAKVLEGAAQIDAGPPKESRRGWPIRHG